MLKTLRKNTKTIIWVVVVLFCLWGGFAFGVSLYQPNQTAGRVFGKEVSYQEYQLFHKASQMFSFSKKPIDDPEVLNQYTWQSVIYSHEAKNQNIQVSDQEVRDEVTRLLKDQKIENPSEALYERWLKGAFGLNPKEFETQIREVLRIQKLVRKINDAPLMDPTEAELRQRFDRENNALSLEIMSFGTEDEAKKFHEKVKQSLSSWESETQGKTQKTGVIALDALISLWLIPEDISKKMLSFTPDEISEPFPKGPQFAVAKLVEKKPADEKTFNDEVKTKYKEEFHQQKKYQRFIEWNAEVEKKAALQDLTPKSASAMPATSVTTTSAPIPLNSAVPSSSAPEQNGASAQDVKEAATVQTPSEP